jgi:hypothetical protein
MKYLPLRITEMPAVEHEESPEYSCPAGLPQVSKIDNLNCEKASEFASENL